jgi:hypothetical protein
MSLFDPSGVPIVERDEGLPKRHTTNHDSHFGPILGGVVPKAENTSSPT